ncbi:MAG: choice-of-anchor Q domain-containing protein [Planctomycetota bacterium]
MYGGIELIDSVARDNSITSAVNFGIHARGSSIVEGNAISDSATAAIVEGPSVFRNNRVYSNDLGVEVLQPYSSAGQETLIFNNLIYDNQTAGLSIRNQAGNNPEDRILIAHNTIYEPNGKGLWLQSQPTGLELFNNIVWSDNDVALQVDNADSQFASNFNVYNQTSNAALVSLNGFEYLTIEEWQATGTDALSRAGDPLWLDPDGADDVLGYNETVGDGGADDDFTLAAGSVAIDIGGGVPEVAFDFAGQPRHDGSPDAGAYERAGDPAPVAAATGAGTYAENSMGSPFGPAYRLELSLTGGDLAGWRIDWGDGTMEVLGAVTEASHYYRDGDATFEIVATALTADDGEVVAAPWTVQVLNRAPEFGVYLNYIPGQPVTTPVVGESVPYHGYLMFDLGEDTITGWHVDWGDGQSDASAGGGSIFNTSHVYVSAGTYTVTTTLSDEDGSYTRSETITVENAPAEASSVTVDSLSDHTDPDDGVTTLREALDRAAQTPGHDTITFDADVFTGATDTILLNDQLTINDADGVTIQGLGADALTLDAQGNSRALQVSFTSGAVEIADLTVTGGYAGGYGGGAGIWNSGDLTLTRVHVKDNTAAGNGSVGGGVFNRSGDLVLRDSAVTGNSAGQGAGVASYNGSFEILNSTISGNTATSPGSSGYGYPGGGSVYSDSSSSGRIVSSTVTGNLGTNGGIHIASWYSSAVELHNTIVAGNAGDDLTFAWGASFTASSSHNLIGTDPHNRLPTGNNNQFIGDADPGLSPLGYYGGPTPTHALLPGSAAIAAGDAALVPDDVTTDQRGLPRLDQADGTLDIGAFQSQTEIVVSTAEDVVDGDYGVGQVSLREAIALAALLPGQDTITFDLAPGAVIDLENGEGWLAIDSEVEIAGPGRDELTIRVGNVTVEADTVITGVTLDSVADANLTLADQLTLDHASLSGGIMVRTAGFNPYSPSSNNPGLVVRDSYLTNNSVRTNYSGSSIHVLIDRSVFDGTLIYGAFAAIEATDSTFTGYSGDEAPISVHLGSVRLVNSTISGNESTGVAGGLVVGFQATGELINTTITDNHADIDGDGTGALGGVFVGNIGYQGNASRLTIHNSIVVGNTAGTGQSAADLGGAEESSHNIQGSYNLIGVDTSGSFVHEVDGNLVGVTDAGLSPLGDYGGNTPTHALLPGSAAIDAGDHARAVDADGHTLATDQRGENRLADGDSDGTARIDIGAVEASPIAVSVETSPSLLAMPFDAPGGYRNYRNATLVHESTYGAPAGGSALVVTANSNPWHNYGGLRLDVGDLGLEVGETYRIGYWARGLDADGSIFFSHQNGRGGNTTLGHRRPLTTEWTYYERTFTLNALRDYLYIWSEAANGPGYRFALDGLTLWAVEPTP